MTPGSDPGLRVIAGVCFVVSTYSTDGVTVSKQFIFGQCSSSEGPD